MKEYKTLLEGVQCWDENGDEYFLTVLQGRHPTVKDTLRVHATARPASARWELSGHDQSIFNAEKKLEQAERSLRAKA